MGIYMKIVILVGKCLLYSHKTRYVMFLQVNNIHNLNTI